MLCTEIKSNVVYLLIPTSNHNRLTFEEFSVLVVYLLIPTSNHNQKYVNKDSIMLYIFWFLHQTTTGTKCAESACALYIFWFLHQTTTVEELNNWRMSCISFDSYIKPQPQRQDYVNDLVVYLLIPTSNHNTKQTIKHSSKLYIFWFLHQTTTTGDASPKKHRCISFDSYIKPQPLNNLYHRHYVVYLLIPTSNHNKVDKVD